MGLFRIILYPFSVVYGIISGLRNLMFDLKILPSESFDVPVISVGNLSVGGTGKTPHVEYLIRLLKDQYRVATLSRGYGRKTKGFRMAGRASNARDIGDEPALFKEKFPGIMVAVDGNRRRGVRRLMKLDLPPDVILLDDAFQHRYIRPGLSILLTDALNLYTRDCLLPAGRLREPRIGAKRAEIIVVTKTEASLSPADKKDFLEELNPAPNQTICYSYIKYQDPVSFSGEKWELYGQKQDGVLLVTGIANPHPLEIFLKGHFHQVERLTFSDHHAFTARDMRKIHFVFRNMPEKNKIIITTEKDAIRMRETHLSGFLQDLPLYYLPVRIGFHSGSRQSFDSLVLDYVGNRK